MSAVNYTKWVFPEIDKQAVSYAAEDCGLDPLVVLIAFARGLTEPYEIEQFIEKEPEFSDPYDLSGMSEAVERINIALESEEKILIFGDYDCDGVTATAILLKYLKSRGADVSYRIPDRETEGYGVSVSAIERAAEDGVTLIITVDNGINATKETERANELGVDVVITDHHLPLGELPDAVAVVDPHLDEDRDWLFCDLCGAGVAFKLVCALESRSPEELIYEYADLAALGTIGDVVPLRDENRSIVSVGLQMLNRKQNIGVRALIEVVGSKYLTAGNVAFALCPRINAAGRMSTADTAVKLLTAENSDDASYYAGCLDRLNAERQRIEQDIFSEACGIIVQKGYDRQRVIVVAGDNWHIGVIGIAASKLTEKYGRPTVVISKAGKRSVGSGRSIGGFSLFDAICSCSELLVKFGGHELAAGLTVDEENIDAFRARINDYASLKPLTVAEVRPDCKIKPKAFTVDAAKALRSLEPFGAGNPVPLFACLGSQIAAVQPMSGGKHLRLRLIKEGFSFQALLFGSTMENFDYKFGDTVDIAVNLDVNVYNERESVSVIIKAIRLSGLDDDTVISQLGLIDKLNGNALEPDEVAYVYPEREDTVKVFKYIKLHRNAKRAYIENDLCTELPLGKIYVALRALTELGIITLTDGFYDLADFNGKADLESAPILRTLRKMRER